MPQFHPQIPSLAPSYTFLRYVVESDVTYSPDHIHAQSRHRRIWEFFCNDHVLKARRLAFRCFKKEADRFIVTKPVTTIKKPPTKYIVSG